jgi:hypothetical protein
MIKNSGTLERSNAQKGHQRNTPGSWSIGEPRWRKSSIISAVLACVLAIFISAPLILAPLAAQQPLRAGAQSGYASGGSAATGQAPLPAGKFSLADFAWLAGRWQGQWGPRSVEQEWTPARAGMMVGIYRVIESDKTLVVEILALSESAGGIEYRIRHFTPGLAPWEKSGSSTLLNLVTMDAKRVVFENLVDGQPKHAILDRVDEDTYVSRSEIAPRAGDAQVVSITFHRQKPVLKKP